MFKSKDCIGLDIGSSYLKVVQLNDKKGSYELAAFDMLQLPPELIVEGSIIDSLRLVEAIKELLKKSRIKAKNCTLGIAGHASVIIRRISLPEMTEEELAESIKFEAEQYVPFDVEDVNLDFQILGPKEEPGQMEVLLVAVKKDIINEYTSVAREAGLNPMVMDVNAFAIGNMFEVNYDVDPDRNVALVNIGANTLNLNVMKGANSLITRDSAVGSHLHTEALQKEFSLSFEAAEKAKMGLAVDGVDADSVHTIIEQASEEIINEIGRSLDFFRSTANMEDINEIVLSGGGALVPGFQNLLAERIGLEVMMATPFKNIKIPGKFDIGFVQEMGCLGAVAVGLALRRPGDR